MTDDDYRGSERHYYLGVCNICRAIQQFYTMEARDKWQQHHLHENPEGAL
jgi:hypothetical protein